MKAWELAETFRAIFAADGAFDGKTLRTGQSEEELVFPAVVFDCTCAPIGGSANHLRFDVIVTVHSEAHDDNAATHAALVELVRAKFYGTNADGRAAARAAMKAAVNGGGKFAMLGRGHDAPAESGNAAIEETRWKTPVMACGSVRVL